MEEALMSAPDGKKDRPKRSRVVIDFETARKVAHLPPKGSRGAKVLGVIAIALTVLILGAAIGGYFWWQSYKKGPAYTLALLVDASQRNDEAAFNEIVDTDKIVENFVPQVTEKALGRYAAALTGPLRQQVEKLVPQLLPGVKAQVREEVTKKVKEMAARGEGRSFVIIALGVPYVVDIKEEGDTAQVGAKLNDRQVELTMQRAGERWKIVAVKDDTMVTRIVDNIAKNLPAIGQELEKEIRKQVDKNLPKIPGLNKQ
jgi:BMFP domain-containing protein YqiC